MRDFGEGTKQSLWAFSCRTPELKGVMAELRWSPRVAGVGVGFSFPSCSPLFLLPQPPRALLMFTFCLFLSQT